MCQHRRYGHQQDHIQKRAEPPRRESKGLNRSSNGVFNDVSHDVGEWWKFFSLINYLSCSKCVETILDES